MTFRDTLDLALRNLGQAKLRTSLTTLGVSIGIASLAGMVSLGVGLQDQFVGRFTKSGMFDSVNVLPGSAQVTFGPGARGRGPVPFGRRGVKVRSPQATQDVQDQIKKMGLTAFSLNDALLMTRGRFRVMRVIGG